MKNRFRNHPSLILEQIGAFWGAVIVFLLLNFDMEEWKSLFLDLKTIEDSFSILIPIAVLLGLFLLRMVFSTIRWYRTWISVDENSITVSVNTLNQSVHTIGIQNISNINIERNLFEMLIGTSTLKIDTDSHSTAECTDVKIVLKQEQAEQLKKHLMSGAVSKADPGKPSAKEASGQEAAAGYGVSYRNKDIVSHCVFTAPITGILLSLAGILAFLIFFLYQFAQGGFDLQKLILLFGEAVSAAILALMTFFSAIYSLIKDFFRYYQFQVHRHKQQIQIEFGLWKRNVYDIPVNRINSIVIKKFVISRLAHRSCVDLINVGTGDEKEENTRLLLSVPDRELPELLHRILPEFDEYFRDDPEAIYIDPPKRIWWRHGIGAGILLLLVSGIALTAAALMDVSPATACMGLLFASLFLPGFYLLGCYGAYRADRLQLHKNYLAVSSGIFAMTTQFVEYKKIQHMKLNQGPVQRGLHLQSGTIYILASTLQSMVTIPAFDKEAGDTVARFFLEDVKT